jgi:hypothetical protein
MKRTIFTWVFWRTFSVYFAILALVAMFVNYHGRSLKLLTWHGVPWPFAKSWGREFLGIYDYHALAMDALVAAAVVVPVALLCAFSRSRRAVKQADAAAKPG